MADPAAANARLQDLLLYPREELDIELKGWVDPLEGAHKADIAKALIALTNHGGGHVVIGFRESAGKWEADPNRPSSLDAFSQDLINGIVAGYAEPGFHCQLHCVEHPQTKELYPIIVVPGIVGTPVRSKRDGDLPAFFGPIATGERR